MAGVLGTLGAIWGVVGLILYRVRAFAYLMSHKMLDGGVGFRAMPATGTVIWLYIKGAFIAGLLGGLASAMIFAPLGTMLAGIESASQLVQVEVAVLGAASYLLLLTVFGALGLVFISQPILGHFVGSVTVTGIAALEAVRQRGADGGAARHRAGRSEQGLATAGRPDPARPASAHRRTVTGKAQDQGLRARASVGHDQRPIDLVFRFRHISGRNAHAAHGGVEHVLVVRGRFTPA